MSAYGSWILVAINSAIFIIFAFSFTHPRTRRDWRSFGAFSAFIVALFTEMYGFPLTIYLLSGSLGSRYPGLNLYSHSAGNLWHTLLGLKGDAISMFYISSAAFLLSADSCCFPQPGACCIKRSGNISSPPPARMRACGTRSMWVSP